MIDRDGEYGFSLVCLLGGHRFENKEAMRKLITKSETKPAKIMPKNISRGIKKEENMAAQIPAKELPDNLKVELGINKQGTALVEKPEDTAPHAVQPRAYSHLYTQEEKIAIAKEGQACGSKAARKVIAEFYGINPRILHGWYMVYVSNKGKKGELTPAKLKQLANARAARGKKTPPENMKPLTKKEHAENLEQEAAAALAAAGPKPEEKYICLDDCQCPAAECNFIAQKTADPTAANCPGYKKPRKKYYCPPNCNHHRNNYCVNGYMCPGEPSDNKTDPLCCNFEPPFFPHYDQPKAMEKKRLYCKKDCISSWQECPKPPEDYIITNDETADACPNYKIGIKTEPEKPEEKMIEIKIKLVDLPEVQQRLAGVMAEINGLHRQIKAQKAGLPVFRWYWVFFPTTIKHYFSAIRELLNK
jgi:hypothetical protein